MPKLTLNRSETIEKLAKRDGLKCAWLDCTYDINESNIITIEHILPRSRAGTDDLDNLELLCMKHNYYRADREYISYKDRILVPINKKDKPQRVQHPKPSSCCNSGRSLGQGDVCLSCGSLPQPYAFPKYLQRSIKECNHAEFHCWGCVTGIYERQQVVMTLMVGD